MTPKFPSSRIPVPNIFLPSDILSSVFQNALPCLTTQTLTGWKGASCKVQAQVHFQAMWQRCAPHSLNNIICCEGAQLCGLSSILDSTSASFALEETRPTHFQIVHTNFLYQHTLPHPDLPLSSSLCHRSETSMGQDDFTWEPFHVLFLPTPSP
jgi:hypothetical protein